MENALLHLMSAQSQFICMVFENIAITMLQVNSFAWIGLDCGFSIFFYVNIPVCLLNVFSEAD